MQEIVIHTAFGGFHINKEMADYLSVEKLWTISKNKKDNPDLFELSEDYYCPVKEDMDSVSFRSNKDLIECVREIQDKYKDSRSLTNRNYIHCLKIVQVEIHLNIINYYDGKEKVEGFVEIS